VNDLRSREARYTTASSSPGRSTIEVLVSGTIQRRIELSDVQY
jgi:hypothetical protein